MGRNPADDGEEDGGRWTEKRDAALGRPGEAGGQGQDTGILSNMKRGHTQTPRRQTDQPEGPARALQEAAGVNQNTGERLTGEQKVNPGRPAGGNRLMTIAS